MSLALLEDTRVAPTLAPVEPGDHDRFAHYAEKNSITFSALYGIPVRALCGKVWIPGRDPLKFPLCIECRIVYDELQP